MPAPSPFLCLAVACIFSASTIGIHAASNISLGSKLSPRDVTGWVSPNQLFRLAFYPIPHNSSSFSLGVLYNSAPAINSTVVWTAGGHIQVGSSGSFEFSTNGNLILKNDSITTVWSSGTAGSNVTAAAMRDDGDFVLLHNTSVILWSSFDTPTDTLVFNQQLPQSKNLTAGKYSASMQSTGNFTLTYDDNGGYTYWSSDTATAGGTGSYYVILDSPGKLSIYGNTQLLRGWYSKDYTATTTTTRRVTLDSDGNLRIYTWSAGSSTPGWTVGWEALEDHCQIYAYCGPNGLCSYNETSVICTCVVQAGYAFNDMTNPRSGCKAIAGNGGQNCSDADTATMVELNNTLLFVSGEENRKFRFGDQDCSGSCLHNSLCTAATPLSDGSGTCQITVTGTFFSGYQELSIMTNSYFKYCGSNTPPAGTSPDGPGPEPALSLGEKKSAVAVPVVVSVLTTLVILSLLQAGIWWICCRKNPRWGHYSTHYALMEYASGAPVQLTYKELRRATGNFKEKLGEGGFGAVYKGELPTTNDTGGRGSATEVAVKRLEGLAEHGEKQFRMEMAVIGSTHHMNLVRLCGFCAEGKERLLVYEYMRNGSLDKYLFAGREAAETGGSAEDITGMDIAFAGAQWRRNMDWETRFSVLLGTARGITYLHQECRDCIIHSDIKPENILLDDNFIAKVSDFGLAKLTRAHQNRSGRHVTTLVRGTRGYLAPEWRSNLPITVKSDVYSFGVVVLETISGRKSFAASSRHVSFPEWAYHQYFHHKQVEGVVDERIREQVDLEQLDRTMKVAFWCVQVQPSARPSMSKVIQMLDGSLAVPQIPPMPKSFGDHSPIFNYMTEEDNSSMTSAASFQQPTSSHTSSLSSSHPPTHQSFSQGLVSLRTPPPDAVPYSF